MTTDTLRHSLVFREGGTGPTSCPMIYSFRYVDVAYLPAYNFTIEDAALVFHHSRLMGISDMVNAVSTFTSPSVHSMHAASYQST